MATDDAELHANVRFQLTLDTDQFAALIVVSTAARAHAGFMADQAHDENSKEILDALKVLNEAKPVRIS
jgi:hypothetical protein